MVGEHRGSAVDNAVARVRRLLAAARGAEPTASAVRRGLVAMLDDLAGSPAQMLTWTSAIDLADELLTLWLSAARARPASVAYLFMARTELSGWTGDLRGGLAAADRAIEVSEEVGSHALTGWTHVFAARICAAAGNEQDCLAHRDAGIALGDRLGEPGPRRGMHAQGHLLLSTGRVAEARGAHAGGRHRERDRVRGVAGDPLAAHGSRRWPARARTSRPRRRCRAGRPPCPPSPTNGTAASSPAPGCWWTASRPSTSCSTLWRTARWPRRHRGAARPARRRVRAAPTSARRKQC